VFLPGGIGDGDLDWHALLEYLTGRFTCYLPSLRGRGLSGDHPDLHLRRLVDDLVAYVDSIGATTGMVGWSAGGMALAVAAQADAVDAVAAVEPTMVRVMDDRERAALGAAVARMGELAARGDMSAAARAFLGFPFNDEEIAVADVAGYFDAAGSYVPTLLNQLAQTMKSNGPDPGHPALLGAISAPMLVLHGSDTKPFFAAGARHVADHVPDARIQEIPGAGHASPLTHPEALAEALTEFFLPSSSQRPDPARRRESFRTPEEHSVRTRPRHYFPDDLGPRVSIAAPVGHIPTEHELQSLVGRR
jgi:pimeloyl-ACP methyl ester carboxylesterase